MSPRNPKEESSSSTTPHLTLLILLSLFTFRLLNASFIQTFFQPDEYFQALEPAWNLAFGPQSGAWLTWEWREGLRTSVHPYLFAAAYRAMDSLARMLDLDERMRASALIAAPRILQAGAAAGMDFWTWRLAGKVYSSSSSTSSSGGGLGLGSWATLALTVLSPWQWHCSARTFSNSLEATLTAYALYRFPWAWFLEGSNVEQQKKKMLPKVTSDGLYMALTAAAAAFYLRPTNIIIWIAISAALVWSSRSLPKAIALLSAAAMSGTAVIIAFASADRIFYGKWVFPPLRFLYMNLVQSLALFYGVNRVDYYLTEGLPLLLTTALPFAFVGIWQSLMMKPSTKQATSTSQPTLIAQRTKFTFAIAILFTVLALSSIAHKEMRFIYPLLPMLHILAAGPLVAFFTARSQRTLRTTLLLLLVAANFFIAYYVSMVHQRGVVDVMHYLRHEQEARIESRVISTSAVSKKDICVGFLMPCHSTPWRSHFVYPEISAWALTCEPPINLSVSEREAYLDEADVFYLDPLKWLDGNMESRETISRVGGGVRAVKENVETSRRSWPEYLVFFEHLEPTVTKVLRGSRYEECERFFNTHWHDDGRRKGDVVVWCLREGKK